MFKRGEGSVWWQTINNVKDGVGQVDPGWLLDNISRHVMDGLSTLFWNPWLERKPLCYVFVRLYEFSENKLESVANMYARCWGVNGKAWKWRCRLFAWEEELLGECVVRPTSVTLQVDRVYRWIWNLHVSNCYSVSSAYSCLT